MRHLLTVVLPLLMLCGCSAVRSPLPTEQQFTGVVYANPLFIPATDYEYVYETVVDVLDDYFKIEHEEPVRLVGNTLVEGQVVTFPEVGSTLLEPWRGDSANTYERLESTLQSIRRKSVVRVIPAQGGFWLDVVVFKELEDTQPLMATAGGATFQYDTSMTRVINPIAEQDQHLGWVPVGRDPALEQRLLGHMQYRLTCPANRPWGAPAPAPAAPAMPTGATQSPRPYLVARLPQDETPPRLEPIRPAMPAAQTPAVPLGTPGAVAVPADGSFAAVDPGGPQPLMVAANDSDFGPLTGPWVLSPELADFLSRVEEDYGNFYSWRGLTLTGAGLGVAAVLANTSLDQDVRNWYQSRVRNGTSDGLATAFKQFGEGEYTIPVVAAAALLGSNCDSPVGEAVGQWGSRSLRAYLVGGPPVLALQYGLGAARPSENSPFTSHWEPFRDSHGVSGHAFVGAVPFLSAAAMTDDWLLKASLVGLSTLPGWSRINDDAHYLSQVVLGWWLAVLSTVAVDHTELVRGQMCLVPLADANMVGIGLVGQR